jgi:hypothetical protein
MAISNKNEKGMTFVWSVLVFGPLCPFYAHTVADSPQEAKSSIQDLYPLHVVTDWIERDLEMETNSRQLVENALLEAAYDSMVAASKRKNGRL